MTDKIPARIDALIKAAKDEIDLMTSRTRRALAAALDDIRQPDAAQASDHVVTPSIPDDCREAVEACLERQRTGREASVEEVAERVAADGNRIDRMTSPASSDPFALTTCPKCGATRDRSENHG